MTPQLLKPRDEVKAKLERQIQRARTDLLTLPEETDEDYRRLSEAITNWRKYVTELLNTLFSDRGLANEFDRSVRVMYAPGTIQSLIRDLKQDVGTYINRLASIVERLDLYEEAPIVTPPAPRGRRRASRGVHSGAPRCSSSMDGRGARPRSRAPSSTWGWRPSSFRRDCMAARPPS